MSGFIIPGKSGNYISKMLADGGAWLVDGSYSASKIIGIASLSYRPVELPGEYRTLNASGNVGLRAMNRLVALVEYRPGAPLLQCVYQLLDRPGKIRVVFHLLCQHRLQSALPCLRIRLFLSAGQGLLGKGIAFELIGHTLGQIADYSTDLLSRRLGQGVRSFRQVWSCYGSYADRVQH